MKVFLILTSTKKCNIVSAQNYPGQNCQNPFLFFLGKYVFASLVCYFRHGREEDEVMGVSFQKELVVDRVQVYPAPSGDQSEKDKLQVSGVN